MTVQWDETLRQLKLRLALNSIFVSFRFSILFISFVGGEGGEGGLFGKGT